MRWGGGRGRLRRLVDFIGGWSIPSILILFYSGEDDGETLCHIHIFLSFRAASETKCETNCSDGTRDLVASRCRLEEIFTYKGKWTVDVRGPTNEPVPVCGGRLDVCVAGRLDAARTVINRLVCCLRTRGDTIVGDEKLTPLITPYR